MEVALAEIKKDIKNLYKIIERQDDDNKSLISLAESVSIMVKEMEYMGKDICEIKEENKDIRLELKKHQENEVNARLGRTNFIEEKIIGWFIVYILGGLTIYFLGK